ncbi:urease accessory protein UreF [Defluviimonas sp. SAOS-178_SWC]|uniref:urease accessory protein UreF n=1 Tax=Defluviimonas sp. SAOS-178_SWC TaxID=3121287 RepID=UPI003222154F
MTALIARLDLIQYLSPAFPTGAFAYSHGLEWAIADGRVKSASALTNWLTDILRFGAGWQDAVLLSLALRTGADLGALDDLARALQPSAERLAETLDQGAAFAATVSALTGRDLAARALPVAVGEATAPLGLPEEEVIAQYLHAFAGNLVSAAIRFMPLGQTEGQAVLHRLHPAIVEIARRAAGADEADLGGATLGADLAAMRHETMEVRIFRT